MVQDLCNLNVNSKTENNCLNEIKNNDGNVIVTGYLSVFANSVDNFTHGLAVAASFLVDIKVSLII